MKRLLIALIVASSLCAAQSVIPTVPASVVAGKSFPLTINFTSGAPTTAVQFTLTLPAGVTVTGWTVGAAGTAAGKQVYCGPVTSTQTQLCLVVGLNSTAIASGVLATAVVSVPFVTVPGVQTLPLSAVLGASAAGTTVATTGGSASITILKPNYDLNGNGLGTAALQLADLMTAVNQVDGTAPCGSANFLSDGCTVADLTLLVADLLSATP